MNTISIHKINTHRKLCILKDLRELELWLQALDYFNEELDHFKTIEIQIIKNASISNNNRVFRRKTVLMIASLCKYEQELKTEYEYGKLEYNNERSKLHQKKRQDYLQLLKEQNVFKNQFFTHLKRYKRN